MQHMNDNAVSAMHWMLFLIVFGRFRIQRRTSSCHLTRILLEITAVLALPLRGWIDPDFLNLALSCQNEDQWIMCISLACFLLTCLPTLNAKQTQNELLENGSFEGERENSSAIIQVIKQILPYGNTYLRFKGECKVNRACLMQTI